MTRSHHLKLVLAQAALLVVAAIPAAAANPEQVQDLGPKKAETSLQYVGQLSDANGTDEAREHSLQFLHGSSESLALGGELQLGYRSGPDVKNGFSVDYGSAIALVRFSDAEKDPVGAGVWLQAGLDTDGELATLESRFILEKKTADWWVQGNAIVRRVNDEQEEGTYLAYSARASHSLAKSLWLGLESSGQVARLSGFHKEPFDPAVYVGPSLFYEGEISGNEATFGVSFLRRVDEHEPLRNVFQLSAEMSF
jgi:hypothetical protein